MTTRRWQWSGSRASSGTPRRPPRPLLDRSAVSPPVSARVGTLQHDVQYGRGGESNHGAPARAIRLVDGTLYRQLAGANRQFDLDDHKVPLVDHVVNAANNADLFQYYYYDGSGDLKRSTGTTGVPPPPRTG